MKGKNNNYFQGSNILHNYGFIGPQFKYIKKKNEIHIHNKILSHV